MRNSVTVPVQELKRALDVVKQTTGATALPISEYFMVYSDHAYSDTEGNVCIAGTNMDMIGNYTFPIKTDLDKPIMLPASKFQDVISSLVGDGNIVLTDDGKKSAFSYGVFSCSFNANDIDAEDFPVNYFKEAEADEFLKTCFESQENTELSQIREIDDKLHNMLYSSIFACSQGSAVRPQFEGANLEFERNKMSCVATDSFVFVKHDIDFGDLATGDKVSLLVPYKSLNIVQSLLNKNFSVMKVVGNESSGIFYFYDKEQKSLPENGYHFALWCRLINMPYVDYDTVINKEAEEHLDFTVSSDDIQKGIKRVSIFADSLQPKVGFDIDKDKLMLTAQSQASGSDAFELIDAKYDGEPYSISHSIPYLRKIFPRIPLSDEKEILFIIKGKGTPTQIKSSVTMDGETNITLLMPFKDDNPPPPQVEEEPTEQDTNDTNDDHVER